MTDRICVAQFGAAHGIRGEVRLRSFTEDPTAVTAYGPLESEDGKRRFEIEALRPAKDHFVAQLAGVPDRDAAGVAKREKRNNPERALPRKERKAAREEKQKVADAAKAEAKTKSDAAARERAIATGGAKK